MIIGSDAIIIHKDDAKKLLDALVLGKTSEDYKRLQDRGLLKLVECLRQAIKDIEGETE